MIVTIHQPDFLPWLGFFDRWNRCDLFIVLDDAQFIRRGWHHRDKVKTQNGTRWLTIPVKKKGQYHQKINEVRIDHQNNWVKKHLGLILHAYGKAPNFKVLMDQVSEIYARNHDFLIDLNVDLLSLCGKLLGITTPMEYASSYCIHSKKNSRIIELLKTVGADAYLTGVGSKAYLDSNQFKNEKIDLVWQEFNHPTYKQMHGSFIKNLSVLDYLMMTTVQSNKRDDHEFP